MVQLKHPCCGRLWDNRNVTYWIEKIFTLNMCSVIADFITLNSGAIPMPGGIQRFSMTPSGLTPKINFSRTPLTTPTPVLLSNTTTVISPSTKLPFIPDKKPVKLVSPAVSETLTPTKPTAVIILTAKRSGSSFVGEIFNQHPDVFFLYEPLIALDRAAMKSKVLNSSFLNTSTVILNGCLQCDFHTDYPENILFKNNPFCIHNSKLMQRNACHTYNTKATITRQERICKEYKFVVLKVIRVHDIEQIRSLPSVTDRTFRIIHLVRDPRPTERSRSRTKPNMNLIRRKGTDQNDEVDLCHTLQQNVKFWKNTPTWLKGKYKMVRFEEIASSPLKMANELYDFVGLTMVESVVKWIKDNTEPTDKPFARSQFSTKRNASAVLDAWRHDMTWSYVQKIQKVCYKAMKSLGYAIFDDLSSLRDTRNPSTLPLHQ